MPARVVVVLDEPLLANQTVAALAAAGYDAVGFQDSANALTELEQALRVEMLITSARFGRGKPNGLALARLTKLRRPDIKVIFTGPPDLARFMEEVGIFIPAPVSVAQITDAVSKNLAA